MAVSAALNLAFNNTNLAQSVVNCARSSAQPDVFLSKVKAFARIPDDLALKLYNRVRC